MYKIADLSYWVAQISTDACGCMISYGQRCAVSVNKHLHLIVYIGPLTTSLYLNITSPFAGYAKIATMPEGFRPALEVQIIALRYSDKTPYAMYLSADGRLCCRNDLPIGNPYILSCTYVTA